MTLKNLQEVVEKVMKKYPETTKDDFTLIGRTYEFLGFIKPKTSFLKTMLNAKDNNYPSCESITRVRRTIKHEHPDWFDEKVEKKRIARIKHYKDYAREDQ